MYEMVYLKLFLFGVIDENNVCENEKLVVK
jgi:hypothetical protein